MAPSGKQAANFSKERRLDDGGIQHDNTDDHQEDDVQAVAPLSVSPVITGAAVGSYSTSKSPSSHDPKEIESTLSDRVAANIYTILVCTVITDSRI